MDAADRDAQLEARLKLLERRPGLERRAAAELRAIVKRLVAAGITAERGEAQVLAERLERAARRCEAWARADEKRLRRIRRGLRPDPHAARVACLAVDAALDELAGEAGRST